MYFDSDGIRLYYERFGEGRPLLLLHGWGCKGDIFQCLIRDFQGRRRVYAVDFPGHGNSPEPKEPWSVSEYADLIHRFIEHAGIAGADVIAHSFGGRVALVLASTHPEDVGRLLLTGCAGLPNRPGKRRSLRARTYRLLRRLVDNPLTRRLCPRKVDNLREALVQRFGSADYRVLSPNMRATFNRVIAQDLGECLPRIRSSTLLIWGEEDRDTPIWMGERMEREIPDAALIRFSGAGHFAFLDRYGDFLRIAESFLLG